MKKAFFSHVNPECKRGDRVWLARDSGWPTYRSAPEKPGEIAIHSMIRAHFWEEIRAETDMKNRKNDLFLMGMFSMIDAILDWPLDGGWLMFRYQRMF